MAEGATVSGCEIFRAGNHRDKEYTRADLDDMVENFRRFSSGPRPLLKVPAVLGHEEDQDLLRRTDLPAAGWPSRVWRDGDVLKADIPGVPPQVARLLRGRAYRTVSAEVYDRPPAGVPGEGKMLRRVAFLGGDIPQIKTLADIPLPEQHAEAGEPYRPVALRPAGSRPGTGGVWQAFSEVRPMNRDELIKKLVAHGVDADLCKDVPDAVLAEMVRALDAKAAPADPDAALMDDAAELPEPRDEEDRKAKETLAAKYMDRCKKMAEKYRRHDDAPTVPLGGDRPMTPAQFSEQFKPLVDAAVKAAVAQVERKFASVNEQVTQLEANTKRANVTKFCEAMAKAGKVLPAELDAGDPKNPRPTLIDRLMRADARTAVEKFSEGGKQVALTELDLQMREIERRPVLVRFGEAVKAAPGGFDSFAEQRQRAEQFYESNREAFAKVGTTREEFLKTFEQASEADRKHLLGAA